MSLWTQFPKNRFYALILTGLVCGSMGWFTAGFTAKPKVVYPELKTASGFSRVVQTITGFTPLSGWIANRVLRRELSRHVKGPLHSRLTLFSGSDLLAGKAKQIEIHGQNVLVDGTLPLTEFSFKNKTDMPLYVSKGSRPVLLRPVQFQASAVMTEEDMNRMLQSQKGQKLLTGIKISIPPFGRQYVDLIQPAVQLNDDKLIIETLMNTPGAPRDNALPVKVSGKIFAEKSKLALSDLDLQIEGMSESDTTGIEHLVEAYFSELVDLSRIKVDRHRLKIRFQKTEMVDKRLHLEALVTVEPERKALDKALKR